MYDDNGIQALIEKYYPSKRIYADDYKKIVGLLRKDFFELRSYCKAKGFDNVRQWLCHQGIYINVEKDMRQGETTSIAQNDTAIDIAKKAFSSSPLIGDIILTDEQYECVIMFAQEVFDRIQLGYRHSREEDLVLTFAIILLIRRNNNSEDDSEEDGSFWSYIYRQFGYKTEDSSQSVYAALRAAIANSMKDNQRYLAPSGLTHKYYTSLMLHALAPVYSMENLFDILLYFYTDELNYDYVPGDAAFSAFVNCIANRWDKTVEVSEDIHLRSSTIASGLRVLFMERPVFMSGFCDALTKKIDALVRNQGNTILNPNSYLDLLLEEWYKKKEEALRAKLYSGKAHTHAGKHADSASHARIFYTYENQAVCLSIPSIRLEHIADNEPYYEIYQDGVLLSSATLDYYGRICWTIRQHTIKLADFMSDFTQIYGLRMKIIYDGETLIDTEKSLYRTCIVFDKNGREIPKQSMGRGQYYLFAEDRTSVQYTENTDAIIMNHPGQLYSLLLEDNSSVRVNGTELISTRKSKSSFHHYSSVEHVLGAHAGYGGNVISIFPSAPEIRFTLPEGNSPLQYRIIIDEYSHMLTEYCTNIDTDFTLKVPGDNNIAHSISIIDSRYSKIVYEYQYVVLDHFAYVLENELYFDDGTFVKGYIQYGDSLFHFEEQVADDESKILVKIDELEYEIEIDIPLVRCTWNDVNLLREESRIWHEDIAKDDFIRVSSPNGWKKYLMLGSNQVPMNHTTDELFEFGNYCSVVHPAEEQLSLYIVLQRSGKNPVSRFLMDIAFAPVFEDNMLQKDETNGLYWMPEGKTLCNKKTEFKVYIHTSPNPEDDYIYSLTLKNERLFRQFPFDVGRFPYEVYVVGKRGPFRKEPDRMIYNGTLKFGSEHEIRLIGKRIRLTKAKCVDVVTGNPVPEILLLNRNAGWLTDFEYHGETFVPYENVVAPMFTATLCFYDAISGTVRPFNGSRYANQYEWINPVSIWLINDHVLLLETVTEDAVSIDKRYLSIVNKKLKFATRNEEYERIRIPDTFEYELMEENDD